jgi:hypothetical protein
MNAQRASIVYGIRLGQFGYGTNLDERTEMLAKEYGLDLLRFPRDDKSFGWYDIVVSMIGWCHPVNSRIRS